MKTCNVYVKDIKTGEVIHSIPVSVPMSESRQERLLSGLLMNTDVERFYVDDSEIDASRVNG